MGSVFVLCYYWELANTQQIVQFLLFNFVDRAALVY